MCLHATTFQSPEVGESRAGGYAMEFLGNDALRQPEWLRWESYTQNSTPRNVRPSFLASAAFFLPILSHFSFFLLHGFFRHFSRKLNQTRTTKRLKVQMQQQQLCHFT